MLAIFNQETKTKYKVHNVFSILTKLSKCERNGDSYNSRHHSLQVYGICISSSINVEIYKCRELTKFTMIELRRRSGISHVPSHCWLGLSRYLCA
jgi:hypothetical protein